MKGPSSVLTKQEGPGGSSFSTVLSKVTRKGIRRGTPERYTQGSIPRYYTLPTIPPGYTPCSTLHHTGTRRTTGCTRAAALTWGVTELIVTGMLSYRHQCYRHQSAQSCLLPYQRKSSAYAKLASLFPVLLVKNWPLSSSPPPFWQTGPFLSFWKTALILPVWANLP